MRHAIALPLIVGAVLVLSSPAQAATVEQVPVYERAVTKEWHWTSPWIVRVRHTRRETEAAYRKVLVVGGAATVTTYICGLIKVVVAEYVCKAAITAKTLTSFRT